MALIDWLQLALTDGIGPILTRRLVAATGGANAACAADVNALRQVEGIGSSKAGKIAAALRASRDKVEPELRRAAELGIALICPDDQIYPMLLRSIPDPPTVLYLRGDLQERDLHAIGIVGSRRCSFYGREQSERFAALLAGAGMTVVSGGARGIDSAAHRGALSNGSGRTIAVLGSGLDVPYPPENASLFDQISHKGAVISEFPLGTPPNKENFPRRNRIISGLSRGVIVIEADDRSGALITARQACDDHGRPVFALPGRVDNPLSAGPHQLLRDGAVLLGRLEDVLDNLGPLPDEAVSFSAATPAPTASVTSAIEIEPLLVEPLLAVSTLSAQQQAILLAVGKEAMGLDEIIDRTGLSAQAVLQELTFLTLQGRIRRIDGQTYAARRN